ncbi:hypothetical protein [Helicobacter sp.]|uniref:hypothetical protein n=1 Tax=Helicobacter sp. TaxID=218 RepID=UPI0025BD99A6|nr:hypothetical protein [Helicobacter sp.]MDY2584638.1 hypothetical protein [Helicobacter sp.]
MRKLLKRSSCFCKVGIVILMCCLCLQAMDFESFYQQVHQQALERNFVRFRNRVLVSVDAYHLLSLKEKEIFNQSYPLVLVFDRIERFITFNAQSGVGVSTQRGSHLQFDIAYYETLKDIGMSGKIHAMCVLPYFDKCILLGFAMF